jgi:thiol-disulfide isomerase/thioredoxin
MDKIFEIFNNKKQIIIVVIIILFILWLFINKYNESFDTIPNKEFTINEEISNLYNVFNDTYINKGWGEEGDGSGPGSEPENTINTRKSLIKLIKEYNVKTLIDAPCGSCKWTKILLEDLQKENIKINYYGFDIADQSIINANKNLDSLKTYHTIKIQQGSITDTQFPKADMILCRDTLQHLSYNSISKTLHNFAKTKSIIVLGGYLNNSSNHNIKDGDYFSINYTSEPFNMIPNYIYNDTVIQNGPTKYFFVFEDSQDLIKNIKNI